MNAFEKKGRLDQNSRSNGCDADRLTISVALACFRGRLFIEEQLRSITSQSLPPTEVVIYDDASDDETFEIVQALASDTDVKIVGHKQPNNRGLIQNFESAISATNGDIIVLADQDDVWYPHKLQRIVDTFNRDSALGLVFSDASLVNQELKSLGQTLWESIRFTAAEHAAIRSPLAFDLLLRRFLVTGATLAFRRSHLEIVLPISPYSIHDAWIALAIAAVARIECINEPLILYRQHPGQQIGERDSWRNWRTQMKAAGKMSPEYFRSQYLFFYDLAIRLNDNQSQWIHPGIGNLAYQKLQHLERRLRFCGQRIRSLPSIAYEVARGEYSRFSYGWKSAAQDIFL